MAWEVEYTAPVDMKYRPHEERDTQPGQGTFQGEVLPGHPGGWQGTKNRDLELGEGTR